MNAIKCLAGLSALAWLCLAVAAEDKMKDEPKEVVVKIEGSGGNSKFVPEEVTVTVGQKVKWENHSNVKHTATSDKTVDSKPLWTTKEIVKKSGDKIDSDSVVFDKKTFEAAGGKAGESVTMNYFCEVHPHMKGKVVVKSAEKKKE